MHKNKGFTLVELMITVAIIGVLAAVAIPSYQKYILKSKAAEAPLLIKEVYDAEAVFASKGQITHRDAIYGDVTCKPIPTFSPVCLFKYDHSAGLQRTTIGMKKEQLRHNISDDEVYDPTDNTCTLHNSYATKHLNLGVRDESGDSSSILPIESYFILRARRDVALSNEYGSSFNDTLMIVALGDLDGDNLPGDDSEVVHCGYGVSPVYSPSNVFFGFKKLSIYARGMYIDAEGDIQGTGMITINGLE